MSVDENARTYHAMREMARENFKVTVTDTLRLAPRSEDDIVGSVMQVVYAEAEAGTGSRYAVLLVPMPPAGVEQEGGSFLAALMHPWQAAYPVNDAVSDWYVAGHWSDRERNVGDIVAVTMLINHALEVATR